MEYITLPGSDLRVSRFCMGGCPMGGYGWGQVHEDELIDAIHAALDAGVNFFDTADTYGLGQSERTLAKGLGSRRGDVVIGSKFGVRVGGGKTVYDNTPAYTTANRPMNWRSKMVIGAPKKNGWNPSKAITETKAITASPLSWRSGKTVIGISLTTGDKCGRNWIGLRAIPAKTEIRCSAMLTIPIRIISF